MRPVTIEPYETIYSWVTRTHRMRGTTNSAFTFEALFEHHKVFIHPYLPNRLINLSEVSGIEINELLRNHTLYSLFCFFHPIDEPLKKVMQSHLGSAVLIAKIPLSGFALRAQHKYCSMCISEMKSEKGYSIIDIRHQIPGVQACFIHGCRLSGIDIGNSLSSKLITPKAIAPVEYCSAKTHAFAQFCSAFMTSREFASLATYDRESYVNLLDRRGFVTKAGNIRQKSLKEALAVFLSDLELEIGAKKLLTLNFLGPLLREQTHTHMHPLAHFLLAFWLFDGDVRKFDQVVLPIKQLSIFPENNASQQELEVLQLLRIGKSYKAITKLTGKSTSYIIRAAQLAGLKSESQSSIYDKKIRYWIVILAQLGRSGEAISSLLNVNVGIVNQVISNTPGLVQWRRLLWKKQRVVHSAKVLRDAVDKHPDWIRKQFSKEVSQDFYYLFHHDRALFERILPPKVKAPGRQY